MNKITNKDNLKFINIILKAKQEIKDGKALKGDLDEIASSFVHRNKKTVNLLYIGDHDGSYR